MADWAAYLKIYNDSDNIRLSKIDKEEVMRYAGMFKKGHADGITDDALSDMIEIMESCIEEVTPLLTYKVSYRYDTVERTDEGILLPFNTYSSKDIIKNLAECDEVVLFAATIGIGIDRLITKYSRISPSKALFLQAIGAERIEALCDTFNEEVLCKAKENGKSCARRYSPGYGDLPLLVQKEFMTLLDCSRRIGVTLNESLLMTPSKSVTAIIGIRPDDGTGCVNVTDSNARIGKHDCNQCNNLSCEYRN